MACIASAILMMSLAGLQATQPAAQPTGQQQQREDDEETPEAARQEMLRDIEESKRRFPVAQPAALRDLLSARLMQGFLVVELKQEPEEWPVVVPIEGQDSAMARISISRKPRDASDAESPATQRFTLILDNVGKQGSQIVLSKVHVFAGPLFAQLNMSMDRMYLDGTQTSVQVIQLLAGTPDQPPLALHLSRNRAGAEEPDLNAMIPADSFVELSRIEPELFEEFVRPMLAELGLAGLFEYTVRDMALQAFLRELPVTADTAGQVDQLLTRLDDADFAQREAAQSELEKLGRPAATALARLRDERELSPEQSTRTHALLVKYEKAQPELIEARLNDREFLQSVAALQGEADDAALAELAGQRLAVLEKGAATSRAASGNDD